MDFIKLISAPHATVNEDHYMGYRIPKGAGVATNVGILDICT